MPNLESLKCPKCQQSDQVQKVTAVVSGTADILRKRLAMPSVPQEPKFVPTPFPYPSFVSWSNQEFLIDLAPKWRLVRQAIIVSIFAGLALILTCIGGIVLLANGYSNLGLWVLLISIALIVIASIVGRISYVSILQYAKNQYATLQKQYKEDEKKMRTTFLLTEHEAWEANKIRIQRAQAKWANELYYCHRDDVVFLPDSKPVSPEHMNEILF